MENFCKEFCEAAREIRQAMTPEHDGKLYLLSFGNLGFCIVTAFMAFVTCAESDLPRPVLSGAISAVMILGVAIALHRAVRKKLNIK